VEEVRVAMALNGGVSLAVWMGGCAVELDRARRADGGPNAQRRVYDVLCECFGRRLVLDILTGASAGGINGALLSAAMISGQPLSAELLRKRWLDLGDFSKLMHDADEEEPHALMKGRLFHDELRRIFAEVLEPAESDSRRDVPGDPVPSLDVTMTDVRGVEKRFVDAWGGELIALEHRPRFKFREKEHFTAEALATAARTSASFPFAFEPVRVEGDARVLAGLPEPTFGIDGGLLDNSPIRAALDLIPTRPAGSRVRRYVCYLNGDPAQRLPETAGSEPGLGQVGAYAVNLPRTAPFVDQLYAIQRAVERPRLADQVQRRLLCLDLDQLQGVAAALFDTYRKRRTLQSLEELLAEPGDATKFDSLLQGTNGFLPWIPFDLEQPRGADGWRWGIRPAQRILHLLLDLLRPAIGRAETEETRRFLLAKRDTIDNSLATLGNARDHVTARENLRDPTRIEEEAPIERLQKSVAKATLRAPQVRKAVETAMTAFYEALGKEEAFPDSLAEPGGEDLPPGAARTPAEALFGVESAGGPLDDAMRSAFYRRVFSIEVVRRAFSSEADIDSAEELRFVQLTPASPSPLFTASPLSLRSPASAAAKLTGVGLGHFAGFYRRSWRANDFMWGRLDAAARIVDLLLDSPSGEVGCGSEHESRKRRIAERGALLADALLAADQRWLVEEALEDAAGGEEEDERGRDLRTRLRAKIEAELELSEGRPGLARMPFTRAVFQRAAQLEIAAEELREIRAESQRDSERGSAAKPLQLGEPGDVEAEVKAVRRLYDEKDEDKPHSLPQALTAREEELSDLGLRTLTQAAFVGLSAARTAGVPLSKLFGLVRTPLLAIAGSVAQGRGRRTLVVLGFWAASILLTARLVSAHAVSPSFSEAWSLQSLAALVADLGALGVAIVPGLRAGRGVDATRNGLLALALVGAAGGVAAALAWIFGDLDSVERLLFAPRSDNPPEWVLLVALGAIGVLSLARLPLPNGLGSLAGRLRGGPLLGLLLGGAFLLVVAFAGADLIDAFDRGAWQKASVVLAAAVAPAVTAAWLAPWRRRDAPREAG
jgi:predicted acylesterase/phospholipase RssA